VEEKTDTLRGSDGNSDMLVSIVSKMLKYLKNLEPAELTTALKELISRLQTHSEPEIYELSTAFIH